MQSKHIDEFIYVSIVQIVLNQHIRNMEARKVYNTHINMSIAGPLNVYDTI